MSEEIASKAKVRRRIRMMEKRHGLTDDTPITWGHLKVMIESVLAAIDGEER